jgi:DNA-binding MarR family transcriptional regulator
MSQVVLDHPTVAVRLAVAMGRLRARLREEAGVTSTGLSTSQLSILQRVMAGPTTAAALSAAEHVTQQAIGQSVAALKAERLVRTRRDPSDGRKTLISVTPAGKRLVDSILASRDAWLVRAIDATVALDERASLDKAIELLERLADTDVVSPR